MSSIQTDPLTVRHYIRRAGEFVLAMQLIRDDPEYHNAAALLAIHAAISYTDALRMGLGDRSLSADDHRTSVDSLRRLLREHRIETELPLRQLQTLLASKTAVAYGGGRLSEDGFSQLFVAAERYASWANRIGLSAAIAGWRRT